MKIKINTVLDTVRPRGRLIHFLHTKSKPNIIKPITGILIGKGCRICVSRRDVIRG